MGFMVSGLSRVWKPQTNSWLFWLWLQIPCHIDSVSSPSACGTTFLSTYNVAAAVCSNTMLILRFSEIVFSLLKKLLTQSLQSKK